MKMKIEGQPGPKPCFKQPGGHCSPGGCSDCPNQGTSCK